MRELSLHVLDVLENALAAGATLIELEISESSAQNRLSIRVTDNGCGMDAETVARVSDPFFTTRTTRNVGLGLPLFKAATQRCNGDLTVRSQPGVGTEVLAEFQRDHIDRAPLGDIKSTLLGVILSDRLRDLRYEHRVNGRTFSLDTRELRAVLGAVPLTHPNVRAWLGEYLDQEESLLEGSGEPAEETT